MELEEILVGGEDFSGLYSGYITVLSSNSVSYTLMVHAVLVNVLYFNEKVLGITWIHYCEMDLFCFSREAHVQRQFSEWGGRMNRVRKETRCQGCREGWPPYF